MENELETEKSGSTANSSSESTFDRLAKELKSLTDAVKASQKNAHPVDGVRSDDKEKIARMESEIESLRKSLDVETTSKRKASFGVDEDDLGLNRIGPSQIKSLIALPATRGSEIADIQSLNDDLYIGMTALGITNPWDSRGLTNYAKALYPKAFKSMNTGTSTVGGNWIPTGFSRNLIELVSLDLRVSALHQRFTMPTNPYTFPVEGADISAYTVAEVTGDNDFLDSTKFVPAGTPGTGSLTFTAKKVGVRSVMSGEITEDSILPIIPYVRGKIARSLAQAQENTVINGDVRVSSNIDGVTVSTVQTTAYDGYRRAVQLAGTTTDCSTFNLSNLRTLRSDMGVFGVDTGQLVYVTGISGYHKLLGLTEVLTMDKIGGRATILNGQIASLDGIPIVLSEYITNTYDGAGENKGSGSKTMTILVRKDMFQFGDWREITLKNREIIETDQFALVALQRLTFKALHTPSASNTIAAAAVNIAP